LLLHVVKPVIEHLHHLLGLNFLTLRLRRWLRLGRRKPAHHRGVCHAGWGGWGRCWRATRRRGCAHRGLHGVSGRDSALRGCGWVHATTGRDNRNFFK
jgi:hypothetical protein